MKRVVILDTVPLGAVTNNQASPETVRLTRWIIGLLAIGDVVVLPEIADYELRRELMLRRNLRAIRQLDALKLALTFDPITSDAMLLAADFWAQARRQGRKTADDKALDGDVILAAQASLLTNLGD